MIPRQYLTLPVRQPPPLLIERRHIHLAIILMPDRHIHRMTVIVPLPADPRLVVKPRHLHQMADKNIRLEPTVDYSNLLSEAGKSLRCERVTEVETVFGQIKHNQRFRRFIAL